MAPDDPVRLPFEENQRTEPTRCRSSNRSTCTTERNLMHNLQSDSSGDGRTCLNSDSEAALRLLKFENMDDNGDASWNLVTSKKPSTRKSVLFVGNLKPTSTSDELKMFIARCAAEAQCLVQVFNCTIFQKETLSSARIMVSSESTSSVTDVSGQGQPTPGPGPLTSTSTPMVQMSKLGNPKWNNARA